MALLIYMLPAYFIVRIKNKLAITIILATIISYWTVRYLGLVPPLITYSNWWWYENMIQYAPTYCLGAYLAIVFPNIITKPKTNIFIDLLLGAFIIKCTLYLWNYHAQLLPAPIFGLLIMAGMWVGLNHQLFVFKPLKLFSCAFYIYALHNPVLIPCFDELVMPLINPYGPFGIHTVELLKGFEICLIVIAAWLIKAIIDFLLPERMAKMFTGSR